MDTPQTPIAFQDIVDTLTREQMSDWEVSVRSADSRSSIRIAREGRVVVVAREGHLDAALEDYGETVSAAHLLCPEGRSNEYIMAHDVPDPDRWVACVTDGDFPACKVLLLRVVDLSLSLGVLREGLAGVFQRAKQEQKDQILQAIRAAQDLGVPLPGLFHYVDEDDDVDLEAERRSIAYSQPIEDIEARLRAADERRQAKRAAGRRPRRTKREMEWLRSLLYRYAEADQPATVRGLFYRCVAPGAITKIEKEYASVQRELVKMRRRGELPYGWITDGTRWVRRATTQRGPAALLSDSARTYRRNLWENQSIQLEVWCEKDALAGAIDPVTREWCVPLYVSRGFSSITYTYEAAEAIIDRWGQSTIATKILFLSDFDKQGMEIQRSVEKNIRKHIREALSDVDPSDVFTVERLAVTEQQIEELALPTRPAKQQGKSFKSDRAVDLDAIPSPTLRSMVKEAIERHVDREALAVVRRVEASERAGLMGLAQAVRQDDGFLTRLAP